MCGALGLTGALPASAQTPNSNYQGCQAFLSQVTLTQGQSITISGSGANAGDTVRAALGQTIGTGLADHNGNFSFPGTIPSTTSPGSHGLTVTCGPVGGSSTVSVTIAVTGAGNGPVTTTGPGLATGPATGGVGHGSLPRTGAGNVFPLVKLGVALIAVGALGLAVSRRRRWAHEPALTD